MLYVLAYMPTFNIIYQSHLFTMFETSDYTIVDDKRVQNQTQTSKLRRRTGERQRHHTTWYQTYVMDIGRKNHAWYLSA